jgi:transposase-like protein
MQISRCRVKEKTQDRLAEFFVGGVTARSAADLGRVNRKTGAYFFHRLRQIIATHLEDNLPVEGLVEVDESYFGGVRVDLPGDVPDRRRRYLEAAVNDVLAIAAAMCAPRARGCGLAHIAVVSLLRNLL